MDRIVIRSPDDWHLHLRQGELMDDVIGCSAAVFARALVMPNTTPPVEDLDDARRYLDQISMRNSWNFQPLPTIQITPSTTPSQIKAAKDGSVIAGKLYPKGVTTGAEVGGVSEFEALWPAFGAMQEVGMVLCIHAELPGEPVMDREVAFIPILLQIARAFPLLRIVVEHVSAKATLEQIVDLENVAATITAHHLLLTIDDILSDVGLRPHHYCKPVPKTDIDRIALVQAATSGDPKFFFGSDSAPHRQDQKEADRGAAGVFTAPVALGILAEVFELEGALDKMEAFTSINGATFYGLPVNTTTIELLKRSWTVPMLYGSVVPLRAGKTLGWQVHFGESPTDSTLGTDSVPAV